MSRNPKAVASSRITPKFGNSPIRIFIRSVSKPLGPSGTPSLRALADVDPILPLDTGLVDLDIVALDSSNFNAWPATINLPFRLKRLAFKSNTYHSSTNSSPLLSAFLPSVTQIDLRFSTPHSPHLATLPLCAPNLGSLCLGDGFWNASEIVAFLRQCTSLKYLFVVYPQEMERLKDIMVPLKGVVIRVPPHSISEHMMLGMSELLEKEPLPLALRGGSLKIMVSMAFEAEDTGGFLQNQSRLQTICEKRKIELELEWKAEETWTWPEEI